MLASIWPLVAVVNVFRAAAVVLIHNRIGETFHATPLHGLSGIAAFWLVILALFLMADRRRLAEAYA